MSPCTSTSGGPAPNLRTHAVVLPKGRDGTTTRSTFVSKNRCGSRGVSGTASKGSWANGFMRRAYRMVASLHDRAGFEARDRGGSLRHPRGAKASRADRGCDRAEGG